MNAENWISLFGSIVLQIVSLIIVLWQFQKKTNTASAKRDADWQSRLDGHEEKFKSTEKAMEDIKLHISKIEEQFNHRFTDYKNEVVQAIRELKEEKNETFKNLTNQLICINKKVQGISIDMAFLKGERKVEGKSKFPSQQPKDEQDS